MDRITKAIEMAKRSRSTTESGKTLMAGLDMASLTSIEVPQEVLEQHRVVAGILTNPVSEYYRMLRTKILRLMDQNGWKVIGVTGPSTGSGKTLTAVNLGFAIAMEPNHSCLVIDSDLRKPAIHKLFGITPKMGLGEYLAGEARLDQVVIRPGVERLGVILNTQQRFGSSDLLMGKTMLDTVVQLKALEDSLITIFDLPPVFVGDDAVAISSFLDAVLIVVDSGKTTKDQLSSTLELLKGVNVLGVVLNNAPDSECLALQYAYY